MPLDLVLLHGLGADHRAFQRFRRLLPDDWRVEAWDLLGHGDAPHPRTGYALDDHARYMAGRLRTHAAGGALPIVAGHSYGAASATAVAAQHPELVQALVLLDPIVYRDHPEGTDGESRTEQMIRARRENTLPETVPRIFPESSPALHRYTIETWQRMAVGVVDEIDHDWMRFAGSVTAPVTIIHGEFHLGAGGDFSGDWFDDPAMVRIQGAGHWLHVTHAQQTADEVVRAVTRMRDPAAAGN